MGLKNATRRRKEKREKKCLKKQHREAEENKQDLIEQEVKVCPALLSFENN